MMQKRVYLANNSGDVVAVTPRTAKRANVQLWHRISYKAYRQARK